MTDLTPIFNGVLKSHEAASVRRKSFSVDNLDDFLKEAYKIVSVNVISIPSGRAADLSG